MAKRDDRQRREAIVRVAILKHAESTKDHDRNLLRGGKSHRVEATVSATVDGSPLVYSLAGQLLINHDSSGASSAQPPATALVARAMAIMTPKQHREFLDTVLNPFVLNGELPDVEAEELAIVAGIERQLDALFKRWRQGKTTVKRGSVRFEPDPDQVAAKAA